MFVKRKEISYLNGGINWQKENIKRDKKKRRKEKTAENRKVNK